MYDIRNNTFETYREQANRQNLHVWNSHRYRQHAARLFQTMQYDRLFLGNS